MARAGDRGGTHVTLSQVAELAGVRPSAVSNWRQRFDDFPPPVSRASDGRDVFSLSAIERWLETHGRLNPKRTHERILFQAGDLLRSEAVADEWIAILCAAVSLVYVYRIRVPAGAFSLRQGYAPGALIEQVAAGDDDLRGAFSPLLDIASERATRLLELVQTLDTGALRDLFELALARRHRFVETRTSRDLADLLVSLGGRGPATIFDPAAGEGGFLLAASRAAGQGARLWGQELNATACRIAKQRLLIHDVAATLAVGDSLADDAWPEVRADIVYCDPPYGALARWRDDAVADRRWMFGFPAVKTTDFAWLEHVIYHLTDTGRGYVLLPLGSLFRRGREADIRRELVRRGAVEAIVGLPAGTAEHTAIPLALWIVRRPDHSSEPKPVLVADFTTGAAAKRGGLDARVRDKIVDAVLAWRQHGSIAKNAEGVASVVPALEILSAEANLLPSRWIHDVQPLDLGARRAELAEGIERLQTARKALTDITLDPKEDAHGTAAAPSWVRVGDLAGDGLAELIRGVRVPAEDCLPAGVRAIRTRDVREGIAETVEQCYVDPDAMSPRPEVTQPGDIIVSPGSGSPIAVVDQTGGSVLVYPIQGLRIRGSWIHPAVAAAFVESPRNRRFVAGTSYGYARIDLRDLELPMVPPDEATRLQSALDRVTATERLAKQVADQARAVRDTLLDLASFGDGPQIPRKGGSRARKSTRGARKAREEGRGRGGH